LFFVSCSGKGVGGGEIIPERCFGIIRQIMLVVKVLKSRPSGARDGDKIVLKWCLGAKRRGGNETIRQQSFASSFILNGCGWPLYRSSGARIELYF
jgi:hypothetical protein